MATSIDDVIDNGEWYSSFSSSNISRFKWDRDTETLTVEFDGGRTYEYDGVPNEIVVAWMRSSSKGRYHAQNIKHEYNYREV